MASSVTVAKLATGTSQQRILKGVRVRHLLVGTLRCLFQAFILCIIHLIHRIVAVAYKYLGFLFAFIQR